MGVREPAPAGTGAVTADANKPFMSFGSNSEGPFPGNDEILAGHGVTLASIPVVMASSVSPWHHFVYTVNPQSPRHWRQIYMDGTLIADALSDLTLNIQTTTYRIAQGGKASGPAANGWWDGDIDEVYIWTKVLNRAEVSHHYQGDYTTTPTTYMGAWYRFSEGSGSTAGDSSGNSRSLSSISIASWGLPSGAGACVDSCPQGMESDGFLSVGSGTGLVNNRAGYNFNGSPWTIEVWIRRTAQGSTTGNAWFCVGNPADGGAQGKYAMLGVRPNSGGNAHTVFISWGWTSNVDNVDMGTTIPVDSVWSVQHAAEALARQARNTRCA